MRLLNVQVFGNLNVLILDIYDLLQSKDHLLNFNTIRCCKDLLKNPFPRAPHCSRYQKPTLFR